MSELEHEETKNITEIGFFDSTTFVNLSSSSSLLSTLCREPTGTNAPSYQELINFVEYDFYIFMCVYVCSFQHIITIIICLFSHF